MQTDGAGDIVGVRRLSRTAGGKFDGIAGQAGACLVAWMDEGLVDVARIVAG